MSLDPNNLLREIDQLEKNSSNVQKKISDIEKKQQIIRNEIESSLFLQFILVYVNHFYC